MSLIGIVMAVLAQGAAQTASQALASAPPTDCDYTDRRPWRQRSEHPRTGVTLLPGYATGMKRSDVRALSPRLVGDRLRGPIELVPGIRGRAMASFTERSDELRALYFSGSNSDVVLKAARSHFGEPNVQRPLGRFIDAPAQITGGHRYEKSDEYRWCDTDRLIVLTVRDLAYDLRIEPR